MAKLIFAEANSGSRAMMIGLGYFAGGCETDPVVTVRLMCLTDAKIWILLRGWDMRPFPAIWSPTIQHNLLIITAYYVLNAVVRQGTWVLAPVELFFRLR